MHRIELFFIECSFLLFALVKVEEVMRLDNNLILCLILMEIEAIVLCPLMTLGC